MKKIIFILLFVAQISLANQPQKITPKDYITQNPTTERIAIINFLQHQFDKYKNITITQESLDPFWENKKTHVNKMRFQIVNQKLYADIDKQSYMHSKDFPIIVKYFQKLLNNYQVNDVDFIIWHSEKVSEPMDYPVFNMSTSNSDYEKNIFILPDFYMMNDWLNLTNRIEEANYSHSWNSKTEKIFWRGITTGSISSLNNPYYNLKAFDKIPRLALVILSKLYPDLIDAKFSYYIGISTDSSQKDLQIIFDKLNLVATDYVDEEDHLSYKYLISIDGNSTAWKRVPWIMLSNSVLLKQETNLMQWFYPALKAYKNYIPVNERLTDIFPKLEWMKNNDHKVKEISENAQNFIKNDLMPNNIEAHTAIILNEYHKLQENIKIIPTLPTAEEALKIAHEKYELERELKKGKFVQFRNKIRNKVKELWALYFNK